MRAEPGALAQGQHCCLSFLSSQTSFFFFFIMATAASSAEGVCEAGVMALSAHMAPLPLMAARRVRFPRTTFWRPPGEADSERGEGDFDFVISPPVTPDLRDSWARGDSDDDLKSEREQGTQTEQRSAGGGDNHSSGKQAAAEDEDGDDNYVFIEPGQRKLPRRKAHAESRTCTGM